MAAMCIVLRTHSSLTTLDPPDYIFHMLSGIQPLPALPLEGRCVHDPLLKGSSVPFWNGMFAGLGAETQAATSP